MIRVLIADDHAMFREMLRIALPRTGTIEVVGEAADGQELVTMVSRTRPDVVLLDYKMPLVRNFASLVRQLRTVSPTTQAVVLSGFGSIEIATHAAEGGARGYVLKSTRLYAVADAIRTVTNGGIWIDPGLPRQVFDIFQRHSGRGSERSSGLTKLTRREREVLACLAEGIANREIASKLAISEKTVKTHLTRIFAKLDVKNRVGAALAFQRSERRTGQEGLATPSRSTLNS